MGTPTAWAVAGLHRATVIDGGQQKGALTGILYAAMHFASTFVILVGGLSGWLAAVSAAGRA